MARFALVELGDGNFLFATERRLFERDFQIETQIVATLRLRRVLLSAAEKIFKNAAARRAAEHFAKNVEWIMKAAGIAAGAVARIERRVAVLVVGGAFLRVAQDLVSLAKFLEFFLCRVVARIFVRMMFHGQLAVSFFDLLKRDFAADFQDFVIIAFGHFNPPSKSGRKT